MKTENDKIKTVLNGSQSCEHASNTAQNEFVNPGFKIYDRIYTERSPRDKKCLINGAVSRDDEFEAVVMIGV